MLVYDLRKAQEGSRFLSEAEFCLCLSIEIEYFAYIIMILSIFAERAANKLQKRDFSDSQNVLYARQK